jgi:FlaG/FlaF family flagellin (archaellin)
MQYQNLLLTALITIVASGIPAFADTNSRSVNAKLPAASMTVAKTTAASFLLVVILKNQNTPPVITHKL